MASNSIYRKIQALLEESNVCGRCTLRFFGIKEYTSYTTRKNVEKAVENCLNQPNNSVEKENADSGTDSPSKNDNPSKRFSPSPCASCLGLLQESCDSIATKINSHVNKEGYIFTDFLFQVFLPVPIDIRHRLFFLHLKEKLGEEYTFEESDIPTVKEICKWVVGCNFGKLSGTDFSPHSHFQVQLYTKCENIFIECFPLFNKCPTAFPNFRNMAETNETIYTKTSVTKAMDTLSKDITKYFTMPPQVPEKPSYFLDIKCKHTPLYLGGRYNKYSRELPQTPWFVDGERKMESSVNELITDVIEERMDVDKITFSASGREDVDVRMLGAGRPFVLELINPRSHEWTPEEIKEIEDEINNSTDLICVTHLQIITKKDTHFLKEGEEKKKKTYKAKCLVARPLTADDVILLDGIKELHLNQKTPLRVLHRRTLATREKVIHSIKAMIVDDHHIELTLETQAGTYVKEFVHGDLGRTTPNLGTLLSTRADILELDVEEIHLDWPPT